MQQVQTSWFMHKDQSPIAQDLSTELNISPIIAQLLVNRGIHDLAQARLFLYGSLDDLHSPHELGGMEEAVTRIRQAMQQGEKIAIYGDYDVDGVCSVSILLDCFQRLSYPVNYYIPDRFEEGYGLNATAIQTLADLGYTLLITVDCGISSVAECELARDYGMEVIITDHHIPPPRQPEAIVINPKNDNIEAMYNLAGVGVAFKLACALLEDDLPDYWQQWLDLVALATVADVVPLQGENRILVKYGLQALANSQRPGIQALLELTGLSGQLLKTWHIGFVLGPRINAAGRLDTADHSVDLLSTRDTKQAQQLAQVLEELNKKRRRLEEEILRQAQEQIAREGLSEDAVLVVAEAGWHEGVIGIVASKLSDLYHRPCIVISWNGDRGKGSGRSVEEFDLYQALQYCTDCLEQYGGHAMAAGLSLQQKQLQVFRQKINEYARQQGLATVVKKAYVDLELKPEQISLDLYSQIAALEPFGEGNPQPVFVLRNVELDRGNWVGGQEDHFRCTLSQGVELIAFNRPEWKDRPFGLCLYDIFFVLKKNEYQGRVSTQLQVRDIQPSMLEAAGRLQQRSGDSRPGWVREILSELIQARPVLVIYPTYRALRKHAPLLQAYFHPSRIFYLHGHQMVVERERMHRFLQSSRPGVFLSTIPYMHYYMKHYELPPALHKIVAFWLTEKGIAAYSRLGCELIHIDLPDYRLFSASGWPAVDQQPALLYANLPATIRYCQDRYPQAYVEVGIRDAVDRSLLRKRFHDAGSGVFISDGMHAAPNRWSLDCQTLLADPPLGAYEIAAFYDDTLEEKQPFPVQVLFAHEELEMNTVFLERVYPDLELVKQVLAGLISMKKETVQAPEAALAQVVSKHGEETVSIRQLRSTLHILSDLGLCEIQKRGSIMAIKFVPSKSQSFDINDSPYFLEGRTAKQILTKWRGEIRTCLARS